MTSSVLFASNFLHSQDLAISPSIAKIAKLIKYIHAIKSRLKVYIREH